jgi:GxxExxY protein
MGKIHKFVRCWWPQEVTAKDTKFYTKDAKKGMTEDELSNKVIGLCIEVHRSLGPGLLENAYKECLYFKLKQAGFQVEKEKAMPLIFDGVKLDCGYRIDLLVEKKLILELKSVDALNDVHLAQTLTYLKMARLRLGLLINFNVVVLKNGIKRVVQG